MTTYEVSIRSTLNYTSEDHGDFIHSEEDAINDAAEWLRSVGANPGAFEITVKVIEE